MADHGHELLFGAFLPPDAVQAEAVLDLARLVEELGLDLLAFQDHPYQPGFLDTWTLLSFLAARTTRVRLLPDVANVPLRPPAVLARSAASLDILSQGRLELGLGAGYFLDAIAAMGGPRRTAAENVDALEEAITVIRLLWTPGPPVQFQGRWYRLEGARPGPAPAHPIGIWVGAYKRRMLELTGRLADAWVPTTGYADPEDLAAMTRVLDAAAERAGRDPAQIRRAYNISGRFAGTGAGFLQGPPAVWAEQLTGLALELGMSAFILGPGENAPADLRRFAEEVAPAVREAVTQTRSGAGESRERSRSGAVDSPGRSAPGSATLPHRGGEPGTGSEEAARVAGSAGAQTLLAVHEHLRQELDQLREVLRQVADGRATGAGARSHLHQMTMRQNYWAFGAFCASYCRVVTVHHAIEDAHLFRDLRRGDPSLEPVLERLSAEHEAIAALITGVDDALVAMIEDDDRLGEAEQAVDRLAAALLPHLQVEEDQLLEPIARLGIRV
jgi:alkanesulfonate monooxygenase SsuD/methylene tetrahydromethanopterin reductase-like flavin-dependent oxidoreductase (luciferase family)